MYNPDCKLILIDPYNLGSKNNANYFIFKHEESHDTIDNISGSIEYFEHEAPSDFIHTGVQNSVAQTDQHVQTGIRTCVSQSSCTENTYCKRNNVKFSKKDQDVKINNYNKLSQSKEKVEPNLFKKAAPITYKGCKRKDEYSKPLRMDWNDYHRLEVIHNFLDDLELDYPSICTVGVIGKSLEGRDLKTMKISNSNAHNSGVWIDAGIHAREWIAPAVATYVANHIARNFKNLPEYMTNKDWYFLPVMNPDGYEYSHTNDRLWRKNRAWHGGQCVGVDLNRNFSCGWGGKGSSDEPKNNFYRGPEPFSEPESLSVKDILMNSGIPFKVYITLHSFGQVIIFPFAYRDQLCADYIRLLEGATTMSRAIFDCNGNTYKVGTSRDVMYGASGTSNDWSYGEAHIPYCYLIELRSKKHKFQLPKEEIEETGNEILNCITALMEFIDNYPLDENRTPENCEEFYKY